MRWLLLALSACINPRPSVEAEPPAASVVVPDGPLQANAVADLDGLAGRVRVEGTLVEGPAVVLPDGEVALLGPGSPDWRDQLGQHVAAIGIARRGALVHWQLVAPASPPD